MLLGLIILCGLLSIVYGIYTVSSLMSADAGSQRMQEISGAVREGRASLPPPAVHHHRGRGRGRLHRPRAAALLDGRRRLCHRRHPVRRSRLHRHERFGAGQRAHGAGGDQIARRRPRHRLPLGRGDRPSRRRPRAARRGGLFRRPDRRSRLRSLGPHHDRRARRARLRRLADLDLRPSRRRHLHQGRRRRRRPRRQGRSRYSRGRPAQSGDDRRQRRRQRRRLRRHGGRPVRDLCGDGGRDHGARLDLLRRHAGAAPDDDVSAGDLRRLYRDLDHRHLLRQARRQQLDHGRPLQGPHRHRRAVDRRPRRSRPSSSSDGARSERSPAGRSRARICSSAD